jgi:N-acetylglucosamine kinase-like BadF-type ATPase
MPPDPPLYAGVDGGATKTSAVVVDASGRELGRGAAGSGNYATVGLRRAVENIRRAVEGAARAAGGAPPLAAVWLGLAGVDRDEDARTLLPHLRPLGGLVKLSNDAELALTALPGALGVALISGTGSIALGRDASGAQARAGGWGHVMGDEGSGWEIGRSALQAIARAADGRGPRTSLSEAVMQAWGVADTDGVIGRVYPETDKALVAGLTAIVLQQAREGDEVARCILLAAAQELALAVATVASRLHFPGGELPLALAGGLLVNEADFREMTLERIREKRRLGQAAVVRDPALSAARAARDLR